MEPSPIDTGKLTRSRLEVIILRILSPLLFWVRLKNSDKDLQEMEEELTLRMTKRNKFLICWPEDIKVGMNVAIRGDDCWRRGWIEKINRGPNMVRVYQGDHGRSTWRPMHEIYRLEDRFLELSWQAIACGLAYAESPTNAIIWPEKTKDLCRILAEGHIDWINIVQSIRSGAAFVKLTVQGENYEGSYNLRDMLIKLGHVELSTSITKDVFPAV